MISLDDAEQDDLILQEIGTEESSNLGCSSTIPIVFFGAAETTEASASPQQDATIMAKENPTNLIQDTTEIASSISHAEPTTEKATTVKLPVVAKLARPYCPVHSHTGRIAESLESEFKAKYGDELYETIFQTFLEFDASLNKMNREIQLNIISRSPEKVYQLIKKLPLFKTMCEIDQQLKDSHKCDDGLKDFLCFSTERHKASGSVLLIYTIHELLPHLKYEHIRYFTSPDEFLLCVNKDPTLIKSTALSGEQMQYEME